MITGDQSFQLPSFPATAAPLKEIQPKSTHCHHPKSSSMPVRLPFVDAAFLQLLEARGGTQELWGASSQPCLYQKQVS